MRKIAIGLCLALIVGLFGGCGADDTYVPTGGGLSDMEATEGTQETVSQEEQTSFTLAYDSDEGFNPYQATALNNQMILSLVYQGLFTMTREYGVEGILCAAYEVSSDYCTHTITLENATFSDGTSVTAADVVASLEAAREGAVYSGRLYLIDTITALDDQTVQIVSTTACENLPMLLDIPITKAGKVDAALPIGSGPYILSTYGDGYVLTRRSDWWCDAELGISQQLIELKGYATAAQIRDAFRFTDLGMSYADPGSDDYAQYRGDYELWDVESGVFLYLVCNSNSRVFSNDAVRAALTYAVDRTGILNECYNGFGMATALGASAKSPFYSEALEATVTCDTEKLRQALVDNGFANQATTEDGTAETSVIFLVNKEDTVRVRAARMIAQTLTDCGLPVELKEATAKEYEEILTAGTFDLYLGQTRLSATMDLTQFFAKDGSLRYGGLADEAIYEMCLDALENSGNYYNLHQMILEDGQLIPILLRTDAMYVQRGLAPDLQPARGNAFFHSLGKALEEITILENDEE